MLRSLRLLLFLSVVPAVQAQQVLHVDARATGAATGASWADAFPEIQGALALAATLQPPVELWVAEGTYHPTTTAEREASFHLRSGVALLGGFAGTENSVAERDPEANPTVLSGDVGVAGDPSDNSYHVVVASGVDRTAVLDGFTVTGGVADAAEPLFEPSPHRRGGGLYAEVGAPTLRRVTFVANRAWSDGTFFDGYGGGAYFSGGDALLEDVSFRDNAALAGGGGLCQFGGRLTLRDAVFEGNGAHDGGGFAAFAARVDIGGAAFYRNTGEFEGGGEYGGGAFSSDTSFPSGTPVAHPATDPLVVYRDVVFEANDIGGVGSALAHFGNGVAVVGGRFVRNGSGDPTSALDFEFGVADHPRRPTLVNVVVAGNEGTGLTHQVTDGGLLLLNGAFVGNTGTGLASGGQAEMVNVTVTENGTDPNGIGGLVVTSAPSWLRNAVIWGNEGAQINEGAAVSGLALDRAIVEGGFDGGAGVLDADPLFLRPPDAGADGVWGTDDDDYGDLRLREGSPAIDFGLATFLPLDDFDLDGDGDTAEPLPLDLGGGPRVLGPNVDLGAYEGVATVTVEPDDDRSYGIPLAPAYPNPTGRRATLAFVVEEPGPVSLVVYDMLGREVAVLVDRPLEAGRHEAVFDGAGLPAGAYLARITTGGASGATYSQTQPVTLVR